MGYEVSKASAALIATGAGLYATGSEAKVNGVAALVIATQNERLAALNIPAGNRPKVDDIKAAVRLAFGGNDKDNDRGRYDSCSLAFRVLGKLEKAHEAELTVAMQHQTPAKLGAVLASLAGRYTEDALRAWVAPAANGNAQKTPGEKLLAYLEKNGPDLTDGDMESLMAWAAKEQARRVSIRQALEEARQAG